MSPVSQAWFTTKEDKDTLTNKGTHKGNNKVVGRQTEGKDLQTLLRAGKSTSTPLHVFEVMKHIIRFVFLVTLNSLLNMVGEL